MATKYVNCGNGQYLNCRKKASTSASIQYFLPHGEMVTTSTVSGSWTKIVPTNYTSEGASWVQSSYLSDSKPSIVHDTMLSALGNKTLQTGRFGRYVYNLQIGLEINADGIFGSGTDSAVRTFQSNNGLTVDGYAGDATKTKLWALKHTIIEKKGK